MNQKPIKKTTKKLNLYCQIGAHDKCPTYSKGTKSDPETFICTCECHEFNPDKKD